MLYLQLQCNKKQNKNKQKETATTTTKKSNGSSYSRAFLEKKAPKIQVKSLKMPPRGLIPQSSSRL